MAAMRVRCRCGIPNRSFMKRTSSYQGWNFPGIVAVKRNFATEVATVGDHTPDNVKVTTTKHNPTTLTEEDLGLFSLISHNDVRTKLIQGIPRKLLRIWSAVGENGIMVRKPAVEILNSLRSFADEGIPQRFLLYGPDKSGKTSSLCQVVYFGALKNWVTVHLPGDIGINHWSLIQKSSWNNQRMDQPELSTVWLKNFRTMNTHLLQNMKTHQQYSWGKREHTEKDSSLLSVVNQGLSRSTYATDAVGVVLKEIRLQSELKVLLAFDAINNLFENTTIQDEGKKWIDVDTLSLAHHFKKILKPAYSIRNGAYVLACSRTTTRRTELRDWNYHELFAPEDLEELGSVTPVLVPNYSEEEVRQLVAYYTEKDWITTDVTESIMKELMFLTAGNPTEIYNLLLFL